MRERQQITVSWKDGSVTFAAVTVDDDAGFGQRVAELKGAVPADIGPVEARLLTVACDGCDAAAELDFDDPRLPDGWAEHDDGDYCPQCQF
jgi:hypothetical protein